MATMLCALALSFVIAEGAPQDTAVPTARALLQRAAESESRAETIAALQTMLELHADDPLAPLAAVHLADHQVAAGQSAAALERLAQWESQIVNAAADGRLSAETLLRARTLTLHATIRGDASNRTTGLKKLYRQIKKIESSEARNRVLTQCGRILGRQLALEGDLPGARESLREVESDLDAPCSREVWQEIELDIPLAQARSQWAASDFQGCLTTLDQMNFQALDSEQQAACQLLKLDTLVTTGQYRSANASCSWLKDYLAAQSPEPKWAVTVALREAEILLNGRKYQEAQQLLRRAQSESLDVEIAAEIDVLLARSFIATADFDAAVECLEKAISATSDHRPAQKAKALWMLGEVHFMQQRYELAVKHYNMVVEDDRHPQWQNRALLQMAKCQELSGKLAAALRSYQQLDPEQLDASGRATAENRIAVLSQQADSSPTTLQR